MWTLICYRNPFLLFFLSTLVEKICGFGLYQSSQVHSYSTRRNGATSLAAKRIKTTRTSITTHPNVAVIVDAENVRGKTNFELGHADLLDRLMIWASLRNHALGRTIVVIDHGSQSTAHLLRDNNSEMNGVCVTFAGPHQKADDVIARDIQWLLNPSSGTNTDHVLVITADQDLSRRCRTTTNIHFKKKTRKLRKKAMQKLYVELAEEPDNGMKDEASNTALPRKVNIIHSGTFLHDLERALREWNCNTDLQLFDSALKPTSHEVEEEPIDNNMLFGLRTKLLSLESALDEKRSVPKRKRELLMADLRKYKRQWEEELFLIGANSTEASSNVESLTKLLALTYSFSMGTNAVLSTLAVGWDELSCDDQIELLVRWGRRRGGSRREETSDRVILAEIIRQQMEKVPNEISTELDQSESSLVELYANYINNIPS